MIVIGVDPHKNTHTAVAVDPAGKQLACITVKARRDGHARLVVWSRGLGDELVFAIEDGRHVTSNLERFLLERGEQIIRVPPHLMAGARRSTRQRGKSDPIDARSVALAALREPELPRAALPGIEREIRLLVDHRESLVKRRTGLQNRLRWHLHDLDPDHHIGPRALNSIKGLGALAAHLEGLADRLEARLAAEHIADCIELTRRINDLGRQIRTVITPLAPATLAVRGCATLSAAKLVGEVGGVRRFGTDAKLAMYTGTAPLDASSGRNQHHRLNRSGNRQINCVIHRIAVTQKRTDERAQLYLKKKIAEGKSEREALRCLKRQIVRRLFHALQADEARRVLLMQPD